MSLTRRFRGFLFLVKAVEANQDGRSICYAADSFIEDQCISMVGRGLLARAHDGYVPTPSAHEHVRSWINLITAD